MANIRSAEKRNRQSTKRREANRAGRSKLRTTVKKTRAAIDAGSDEAKQALDQAYSVIDRAATRGVIQKNAASRYKSRLSQHAKKTSAKA